MGTTDRDAPVPFLDGLPRDIPATGRTGAAAGSVDAASQDLLRTRVEDFVARIRSA